MTVNFLNIFYFKNVLNYVALYTFRYWIDDFGALNFYNTDFKNSILANTGRV